MDRHIMPPLSFGDLYKEYTFLVEFAIFLSKALIFPFKPLSEKLVIPIKR